MESPGLILPPGVAPLTPEETGANDRVTVVNETGLPDEMVVGAARDHFVESASLAWGRETSFQTYANQGSLLARSNYQVPSNVIEEIKLARDMADRDDDVASAIGWCLSAAFESGMENHHRDEKTVGIFNAICADMDLDRALVEFYREWLISAQLNSLMLFTRTKLEYEVFGRDSSTEISAATPLAGVLPAENVRVLGNDIFGTGVLAYDPDSEALRTWLNKYFDPSTTAAEKAAMGREDRVTAAMFTGVYQVEPFSKDAEDLPTPGDGKLYILNPRLVHRRTMPKGARKYPPPPLTRNFALLEAKRLLNILDYSLLQGGSNFIVVAKKGTDDRPALPAEIQNLQTVVRQASRTGVIVGDHRLSFEILTPNLSELLNPQKRRLLGRKLAMALLRTPEHGTEDAGTEGMKAEMEMMARVITADRHAIKRHIERHIYAEVVKRNRGELTNGSPSIFFPKVILQGTQFFTDYILKLRDRGDIPRRWAVESAGFPFDAAIQQRQRELDAGVDETMAPAAVPFSNPEIGPQDNNDGRPTGARTGQPTEDPARPKRTINQNPGETIRAIYDEVAEKVVRVGAVTHAVLDEYDGGTPGRIRSIEREVMAAGQARRVGSVAYVPVNPGVEVVAERALNLAEGLRMIVGERRSDRAFVARLLVFREPEFSTEEAETRVARWGFPVTLIAEDAPAPAEPWTPERASELAEKAEREAAQRPVEVHIHEKGTGRVRKTVIRDDAGNIIGSEEVPIEEG